MKRCFSLSIVLLVSMILISPVYAESNDTPISQAPQNQIQPLAPDTQIVLPKAGVSWKEKVMMQRYLQKRGAESRNTLKRKALPGNNQTTVNGLKQTPAVSP